MSSPKAHCGSYLDPQLISKRKVGINSSTSLQMYSFGRERRFRPKKKQWDAMFYDLPSVRDTFTTTFGFGSKMNLYKNPFKNKTHAIYDIPRDFTKKSPPNFASSPCFTFGGGRGKHTIERTTITPGVGTYELRMKPGKDAKSFSLFGRTWDRKNRPYGRGTPGPGSYEDTLRINRPGKYCTSLFNNTWQISFGGPKRFKTISNDNPSPGAYNIPTIFNKTGFHFSSGFHSSPAKTMSNRPPSFYRAKKSSGTPGPGSYEFFSEFAGFAGGEKRCRCGRKYGHKEVHKESCIYGRNHKGNKKNISKNTDTKYGYNTITSEGAYRTTKNDTI